MKGFSTRNGDVVVGRTIELATGLELLRQKVELVLGTNQGEWAYDKEEGINFRVLLIKNPDEAEVRATIEGALVRIDETFAITEFEMNPDGRHCAISFKAVNASGLEVGGDYNYGD